MSKKRQPTAHAKKDVEHDEDSDLYFERTLEINHLPGRVEISKLRFST